MRVALSRNALIFLLVLLASLCLLVVRVREAPPRQVLREGEVLVPRWLPLMAELSATEPYAGINNSCRPPPSQDITKWETKARYIEIAIGKYAYIPKDVSN